MRIRTHHLGRTCAIAGVLALAAGAPAAEASGNNGTIKIDGVPFDSHPDDEPHVGCRFQVDFYGYEANVPVTMAFTVQPPTGGFQPLLTEHGVLDGDGASGADEEGLDGEFEFDLTALLAAYAPHPNQGWHVRLDITADDDDQGAEGKAKTFWVTGCTVPPIVTTTTTTSTTTSTTGTTGTTQTTATTGTTATTMATTATTAATATTPATTATPATATTAPEAVLGASASQPQPPTEVAGTTLARTGGPNGVLLVVGTLLLLYGAALEVAAARLRR